MTQHPYRAPMPTPVTEPVWNRLLFLAVAFLSVPLWVIVALTPWQQYVIPVIGFTGLVCSLIFSVIPAVEYDWTWREHTLFVLWWPIGVSFIAFRGARYLLRKAWHWILYGEARA